MSIHHAGIHAVAKPWGRCDLSPWAEAHGSAPIGEIWFECPDGVPRVTPALLLKLIFTEEPLSIQVHPDDDFAQRIGLHHGKTEAWYILSAKPGAQVAVGLKLRLTRPELRRAIIDGSIADIVEWRSVVAGDTVFVPAGTIHAIGAGLVVAEIQQRSDTTFRLFDYGRGRELHIDQAVAAAELVPADIQDPAVRLTDIRTQLVSCPYFTLEHIDIPSNTLCELNVECESWAMVIAGDAIIGLTHAGVGAVFSSFTSRTNIRTGRRGLKLLVGYAAAQPARNLLCDLGLEADEQPLSHIEAEYVTQATHLSIRTREVFQ
jgi:mannose-6-phosphate isomerase